MRQILLASGFALALAACGTPADTTRQVLIDACLEDDGATDAQCTCMADQAVEKLDPKVLTIMMEAAEAEDSDAYMMSKIGELAPEDMQNLMTFAMSAATECELEMN